MIFRRTLQFFLIFPATLFLPDTVISYSLWSSPDTSPRIDALAMLSSSVSWSLAYLLFMAWALRRSGSINDMPGARRLLYVSPIAVAAALVIAGLGSALLTHTVPDMFGVLFVFGLGLVVGYAYAVFAAVILMTISHFANRHTWGARHGP